MSTKQNELTKDDAARIAALARLDIDEAKLETFTAQFADILGHVEALGEVDTENVEPLYSPVELGTVTREDEAEKRFPRADVLGNAPETDGSFFIVPKIV